MKKRVLILLLAMLVMAQAALASVTITSSVKDKYNIGEQVQVEGTVASADGVNGFIRTSVECGDESFPSALVPLLVAAGSRKDFPPQVAVQPVRISSAMQGECNVRVAVIDAGLETDYAVSDGFTVTKELEGTFKIAEKTIQVGKPITVTGSITRLDTTAITGTAEIYNVYGGIKYLLDVADINEGQLSFTYITKPVPTGEYVIEVLARDSYGNEQRFEAASYALTNQLNVIAQIPRTEYLPGEAIKVTGELKNVEGEMVTAATAYVSFEGTESAAKIKNGRFEYEFKLADAIKSGRHSVTVSASDELGNSGAVSVLFSVTPVATRLELEMPKTSASPLESIDLTPKLFDQANDVMGVLVNIEMKDANGDAAVSNQYESGKKLRYNVGQYAVPGDWKVKASYGRLKSESAFTVAEVKELQIGISGAVLTFTNTGNARWRDDIAVSIDSAEQHFKDAMRDSIKPGASGQLDLGETAPSGTYTVSVALPDRTETFENVAVANGKKVYNLDFVYAVMLLVVVGLIAYELTVLLHKSRHNKYRIGNDDLHRLARHAQKKWDEKSYEATEKAKMIEDYKRMTLEEIKRTEEKMNPPYPADKPWRRRVERKPSSPQKKDEGKGGDMSGAAGFFGAF